MVLPKQAAIKPRTEPTRSVYNVDIGVFPHGVGGRWLNGDSSLSLQFHGVHDSTNSVFPFHLNTNTAVQIAPSLHSKKQRNLDWDVAGTQVVNWCDVQRSLICQAMSPHETEHTTGFALRHLPNPAFTGGLSGYHQTNHPSGSHPCPFGTGPSSSLALVWEQMFGEQNFPCAAAYGFWGPGGKDSAFKACDLRRWSSSEEIFLNGELSYSMIMEFLQESFKIFLNIFFS